MRRRIMMLVVGMTTLVVLAFAIPLAVLIRHTVYDDAVTRLKSETSSIALYLTRSGSSTPTARSLRAYLGNVSGDTAASVVLPDGIVVGHAPPGSTMGGPAGRFQGLPATGPGPLPAGPPQPEVSSYGDGQLAVLHVPGDSGPYLVRVWASNDVLHAGDAAWWGLLAGASAGLLLLGIASAELITRRLVQPLESTAGTAHKLANGDVAARVVPSGPAEVAEVGHALNRLATRIDQLIADERETLADLSHRLRTPLTALRLDAEALHDPREAERVNAHVATLERMLTATIRAARRPQRAGRLPVCDAASVVQERLAFWSALAEDQGRACSARLPERAVAVRAADEDLAAAVDALLENVIAHTPEGTGYTVRLAETEAGARLEVSDDGPGLPPDAGIRGRSDRGSSGLGLDIARRCAQASGGAMSLGTSEFGGAQVTLTLGTV